MPNPIRFVFDAATKGFDAGVDRSERVVKRMADTAERSGRRVDSAFESTAGHADNVASKGAQAAGALGGLGDLASQAGGPWAALGGSMMTAGIATQAAADAGDLLNVVTESTIGKAIASRAATIASSAAQFASASAAKVAAAGQWALNAAMSANPIALVVIALVALVAAFVIAYKKSETFRNIVNGAFGAVLGIGQRFARFFTKTIPNAVSHVVGFVRTHWRPILAIIAGPLGLIVLAVTKNLDKIKGAFTATIGFVKGIPGKIRNLVGSFTDAGGALIRGLIDGLSHVGGSIANIGKAIVNSVIGFLNDVLPHSISINKGPIHVSVPLFPSIPMLASGGIVYGPTLALIGEAGPEAVVPLGRDRFGHRTYSITVQVPVAHDLYTVGETIVAAIREFEEGGGD